MAPVRALLTALVTILGFAPAANPDPSSAEMVYALDPTTGERLWAAEIDGDVAWYRPQRTAMSTAITASAGWLIVADQSGTVAGWQDIKQYARDAAPVADSASWSPRLPPLTAQPLTGTAA